MSPPYTGRSFAPGEKGQTAVLGLVLLIGMVAIVSVGMLVVAGDTITSTEQETENERVEQAFVELSQQMATASSDSDTAKSMNLDAGESGAVVKTDTGQLNITGSNIEESINISIGAIEYEGDDGTKIAYQAGGVFRETGQETRVVSAPPLDYNENDHTFSFPIIEIEDEAQLGSSDIMISHADTTTYNSLTNVEDSTITIEITSEYCIGWQNYFEKQTQKADGRAIQEQCTDRDEDRLKIKLGKFNLDKGTFKDSIVANETDLHKEDFEDFVTDGESHPPLDNVINSMIKDKKNDEDIDSLDDAESPVQDGIYFIEELKLDQDGYTFNVENGNTTLIVENDIILSGEDIYVEGWGENNNSLQIYAGGDMYYENPSNVCADNCEEPINAQPLQIYGTSEMHIGFDHGNANFEGLIYAPTGDSEFKDEHKSDEIGCEMQLCIQSAGDIYGSVVVSSAEVHSSAPEGMHDPDLEYFGSEINPPGYVFPPDLAYLNVAVHEIDMRD